MIEKILTYHGQQDKDDLISLFNKINQKVDATNIPTNLYTYTGSPIDLVLIDFKNFDIEKTAMDDNGMMIIIIDSKYSKNVNHLIIKPHTALKVKFDILPTSGDGPTYDYLAIRLDVEQVLR